MENEDIIKLANKYAEEMISNILSLVPDNRSNRIDELKAVYKSTAESFLRFLLKDYYIVEKVKF